MSDDSATTIEEMLTWVHEHTSVPEIAHFLAAVGERTGQTLYELAQEKPDEALELCEALFWMVEDEYTPEQLHEYFKRNQPERRYDTQIVLPRE